MYVKGGDNTVADVLSCMPDEGDGRIGTVAAVMMVLMDPKISADIRVGYSSDSFCQKILGNLDSFPAAKVVDGLIYISLRLVIPRMGTIREELFRLVHDSLGHFGVEKSYANL